ncbi:MAG: lytic transglycosylase domain-containing protein [bacterium]
MRASISSCCSARYFPALCLTLLTVGFGLAAPAMAHAETLVSATSGDKETTALASMLTNLHLVAQDQVMDTVQQLRFLENQYHVDAFLLVAICDRELQWPTAAKGHVWAYNLKNGIQNFQSVTAIPNPFHDLENCASGLAAQKTKFSDDINATVVAYFAGPMQTELYAGTYPAEYKEMLSNTWAVVKQFKGPLKASQKPAAATDSRDPHATGARGAFPGRGGIERDPLLADNYTSAVLESYRTNDVPADQIEEAYVSTMRYFNRRIREDTAKQIYGAVAKYAGEYQGTVDARLVMALVATESNFNPNAVSPVGAQGLGQLMPFTADSLNVADPFDIDSNIRGTFIYLDREFRRWQGQDHVLDRVLASYNAGPGAVTKYNGIPPYEETKNYVRRVVNIYCAILQPHEREAHLRGNTQYDQQLLDGYKTS